MRNKLTLTLAILLYTASSLFADSDNRLTYKMIFDYSDAYVYKYIHSENTKIKREYSDKSLFNFSRDSKIFFHYKSHEVTKTGFETIAVITDSIRHTLDSAGKRKWHFNTKDPNCFEQWNSDIANYQLNVGKEYKYVISPYYEIADIVPGTQMKADIEIIDSAKDEMNPIKFIMYRNALNKAMINQITDVKKIDYPIKRVPKDSVWKSNIEFVIDGVHFYDTVEVKFIGERGGYYMLESAFTLKQFIKNQTVIYGPSQVLSEPMEAELNCAMKFSVTARGQIDETSLSAEGKISFINQDNKTFTDYIKTNMLWKADGRFEY